MQTVLLVFDIGTSGLKASLVDERLNILRNVTATYPTHYLPNGGVEQDAADWWMSAVRAMMMLRELAPESVKRVDAIGISGHMLGCLPMDRDGQTLRPAMIHADTRALSISNGLRAKFGRDYFYQICGNVLSPASTLCKTLWLKENEPELYARTARILQSKDYLVYRLMGNFGVASPLCSYVYITVNGEDWGLYLAVEGVEDAFLERNYGKEAGELYKPDSMSFGGGRGNGRDFDMEDFEFDADGLEFHTRRFSGQPAGRLPDAGQCGWYAARDAGCSGR